MKQEYNSMYSFLRQYCSENAEMIKPHPNMSLAVQYAITSFNHRGDSFSGWINFVERFMFPFRRDMWLRDKTKR